MRNPNLGETSFARLCKRRMRPYLFSIQSSYPPHLILAKSAYNWFIREIRNNNWVIDIIDIIVKQVVDEKETQVD
jgi:hypothetical protein